jgi:hypothetical protein
MSLLRTAGALALALVLPACSNGITTDPAVFPSPGPTTVTYQSSTFTAVAATDSLHPGLVPIDVTGAGVGRLDMTVDWTTATSDVDFIVTTPACASAQAAYNSQCSTIISDRSTNKPARGSFSSTTAQNYKVWIYNFGKVDEAGTLTVLFTP